MNRRADKGEGWLGVPATQARAAPALGQVVYQISQAGELSDSAVGANKGLNWAFRYVEFYHGESAKLLSIEADGDRYALPQVPILLRAPGFDISKIAIDLQEPEFIAETSIHKVLEIHKEWAAEDASNRLHGDSGDEEYKNARLIGVSEEALRFQGCSYFDYISTNLALDFPRAAGTLREQLHPGGRLEPLEKSALANSCGVNGLVFSSDGHMILQRRSVNLLIRPGELCSGFSGTITKKDIVEARSNGGTLESLYAVREGKEELGIPRTEFGTPEFLGITRELIRGGTPDIFYAVNVRMRAHEILALLPPEKEGNRISIDFGTFGKAVIGTAFPMTAALPLSKLLDVFAREIHDEVASVPLLTNILLWHRLNSPLTAAQSAP